MNRLALTLPLVPNETQTSYVSRLAARNGCASAYEFCHDVGLDWRGVINGDVQELARLADISGTDVTQLNSQAIRVVGRRKLALAFEVVSDKVLERTQVRLCPICAGYDTGSGMPFMAIQRLQNIVAPVLTCPSHGVPLVNLPRARFAIDNFDVTAIARNHRHLLEGPQARLAIQRPAEIEAYMIARLVGGQAGNEWLDTFPPHVISRASEVIGLRDCVGEKAALSGHNAAVLASARAVGFRILEGGPNSVAGWLEDTCISEKGRRRRYGQDLGPINTWLTDSRLHPDYFPLRKVFAEFVLRNFVIKAGSNVLGQLVAAPHLLPTRLFAREAGVSTSFVRDAISAGLVPEPPSALGDLSFLSLITAEQATAVRKLSVEVIEPIEARARLGCSEGTFASILKAGLVRPFQEACQLRWYFRPDVLALIDRILELPIGDVSDDSFSLTAAAQASKRSIGELLRMLVSHEVPMMRLGNGDPLLASVVLTRNTVSDLCPSHGGRGILRSEVAKTLGVSDRTIARLLRLSQLESLEERHPMTGGTFFTVNRASLDRFHARYIAIARAGEELGEPFQAVQSSADRLELAFLSAGQRGARFLQRKDLPLIAEDLQLRQLSGKRRGRPASALLSG